MSAPTTAKMGFVSFFSTALLRPVREEGRGARHPDEEDRPPIRRSPSRGNSPEELRRGGLRLESVERVRSVVKPAARGEQRSGPWKPVRERLGTTVRGESAYTQIPHGGGGFQGWLCPVED